MATATMEAPARAPLRPETKEREWAIILRHTPFPGRPKTVVAASPADAWQKMLAILETRIADPGRANDKGAKQALAHLAQAQREWLSLNKSRPADCEILLESERADRLKNLRVGGQEAADRLRHDAEDRQLAVWERLAAAIEALAKKDK